MKSLLAFCWLLLLVGCVPPEAPQDPSTVTSRIEIQADEGYPVVLKGVGALTLPYVVENPGELVWELETTPEPGYPEPVWTVTFPEEHLMTYHRRNLTVRLLKNSLSVWVGPSR